MDKEELWNFGSYFVFLFFGVVSWVYFDSHIGAITTWILGGAAGLAILAYLIGLFDRTFPKLNLLGRFDGHGEDIINLIFAVCIIVILWMVITGNGSLYDPDCPHGGRYC